MVRRLRAEELLLPRERRPHVAPARRVDALVLDHGLVRAWPAAVKSVVHRPVCFLRDAPRWMHRGVREWLQRRGPASAEDLVLAARVQASHLRARRGARAVKQKFFPVVREPWIVVRGERVAFFCSLGRAPWRGRVFSQNRDFGVACKSFMCNDSISTH